MTISSSRTLEFDIAKIVRGGMVRAGIMGVTQAQAGPQYEAYLAFGQQELDTVVDHLQAEGIIVRAVDRYELAVSDGVASYELPSSTLDVFGWATYLQSGSTTGESSIRQVTREEYMLIPNKTSEGSPQLYYCERLTTVQVYFWPVPDSAGTVTLQRHRLLADSNDSSKTVDLERHWVHFLCWELGHLFAIAANRSMDRVRHCRDQAREAKKAATRASRQRPGVQIHMTHSSGVRR